MRNFLRAALVAVAFVSAGAVAEAQVPNVARFTGQVTAISATQVTLALPGGASQAITLAPDWGVQQISPIGIDAIRAGSFIGTANVPGANGQGRRSLEVHVFPPGLRLGEGDYDWDPGSRMTNGDVGRVTETAEGREIDVSYPGGVRTITVPANVPITQLTPGTQAMVRVGSNVNIISSRNPDGSYLARFIGVFVPAPAAP